MSVCSVFSRLLENMDKYLFKDVFILAWYTVLHFYWLNSHSLVNHKRFKSFKFGGCFFYIWTVPSAVSFIYELCKCCHRHMQFPSRIFHTCFCMLMSLEHLTLAKILSKVEMDGNSTDKYTDFPLLISVSFLNLIVKSSYFVTNGNRVISCTF